MASALRWFFACIVFGCTGAEPTTSPPELPDFEAQYPNTQAVLSLGTPTLTMDSTGTAYQGKLLFSLDDRYPVAGAKLLLNELWLNAEVWLNDQKLAEVSGGSFPGVIELPDRLRPGQHTLQFRITAAQNKSGLLQGARKDHHHDKPDIGEVLLHLAPKSHIEWMAFPSRDGKLIPRAAIEAPSPDSVVEFNVYRDGVEVQSLGRAPVIQGIAQAEPIAWEGEWWSPKTGAESLYQFSARLLDAQDIQLDRTIQRSGVRDLQYTNQEVLLNGEPSAFVAVRMEESWKRDGANLKELLSVGVNTIEIHGSYPPKEWLELADEAGIQIVLLPRCDGEVFAKPSDIDQHQQQIRTQQDLLAKKTLHHPSMLFWTTEGTPQLARRLSKSFEGDPLTRLVTGRDIPALSLSPRDVGRMGERIQGSWITEITNLPGSGPEQSLHLFEQAIEAGAIGGVLPVSRNQPSIRRIWIDGMARLAEQLGTGDFSQQKRRTSSRIQISGLQIGAPVWASTDHVLPTGSIASNQGTAEIQLFHEGPVAVIQGSSSKEVTLEKAWRQGAQRLESARRLQWSPN